MKHLATLKPDDKSYAEHISDQLIDAESTLSDGNIDLPENIRE
jgi:hypothetical protein